MLPGDKESILLDSKRVFLDDFDSYGMLPQKVYKLTRNDDVLFTYQSHGSVLSMIADRDEFNPETDNQELGICDYIAPVVSPEPDPETGDTVFELHLSYRGRNTIVAGGNAKKFTCYALASDGQDVILSNLQWTVTTVPENAEYIHYNINEDNSISIYCDYAESVIGTQFLLTAAVPKHTAQEYIEIGGGI